MSSKMSIGRAAAINAAAKYSTVLMNLVFTAILARILTPAEYGIVAVVTIFVNFFGLLCSFGFGTAVIQQKDLSDRDLDSIFTLTLYMGVGLGALFALLGFPISWVYGSGEYVPTCAVLGLSVFFNTLNMVPNGILMREKQFKRLGIRTVVLNAGSYAAAVGLALLGFKHYSLVMYSVLMSASIFAWNHHTTKLRMVKRIDGGAIRRILSYSFFQFAFSLVGYLETNLDNLLVSTTFGSTALSFYDKSYKLTKYPVSYVGGVVSPVLHPILSEYQDQKEIIYRKYVSILKILSSACLFIVPVFFCCSQEIVLLFYGGQWGEAVLPFHYLSLAVYPLLLMSTTGSIYQSANNTKLLFVAGAINATVTFAFIAGGLATGSVANVALSVGIANWINMCVTFFILMRFVLKAPLLGFVKTIAPDIVLMALFVALQSYLSRWLPSGSLWFSLLTKGAVAAACYLAYLVLTGQLKALLAAIRKRTGKGAQGACKEGDAQ